MIIPLKEKYLLEITSNLTKSSKITSRNTSYIICLDLPVNILPHFSSFVPSSPLVMCIYAYVHACNFCTVLFED